MRYIKLYENFDVEEIQLEEEPVVLSDKTIDDVLGGNFFDEEDELEDDDSFIDNKGISHIKNWNVY
jgi:hypothetical protein